MPDSAEESQKHHPSKFRPHGLVDKGKKLYDNDPKVVTTRPVDQYRLQAESFSRAVRRLEPLAFGVEDAIRQMRVIDALFRSSETGRWEGV